MTSLRSIKFALAFGVILATLSPVPGYADATSAPAVATDGTPAGNFIQDLGNKAIQIAADKSLSDQQHTAHYRELLNQSFDLKTIGHFVIGRAWDSATPEQRQDYMKLFEALVLKTYGNRLKFYSGESFHVKSTRRESDIDSIVSSEIDHTDGSPPTGIDWRVRQKDGHYAIIDVVIAGVSQSVTQRQEYSSVIQRDGGKIDGLLTLMRQRVEQPDSAPQP